jgi:response regulator NasT
MSEKDAHRYIEKQAMDMRQTKKEIALRILKTYET